MRWSSWILVGAAIVLSLSGGYLSAHLLVQHVAGKSASPLVAAVCGGAMARCDKVLKSRWGVFPPRPKDQQVAVDQASPPASDASTAARGHGIPVAFLGLWYFSFLAAWFLGVGRPNERRRAWQLLPVLMVLTGNVCSALFIYVMATKLTAWCPGCLMVHVVNFLLLLLVLVMWPRRGSSRAPRPDEPAAAARAALSGSVAAAYPSARLALITIGLGLALCMAEAQVAVGLVHQAKAKMLSMIVDEVRKHPDLLAGMHWKQEAKQIEIRQDDPSRGNAEDAGATLVLFGDLTCAECKRFDAFLIEQVEPLFDHRLRVVLKHYPMCTECNPGVQFNISPYACEAAYAAEAARLQGGNRTFWQMHDAILAQQDELGSLDYAAMAARLGIDGERLRTDMQSSVVRRRVAEDIALAQRLGVRSTPEAFLADRCVGRLAREDLTFWKLMAAKLIGGSEGTEPVADRTLR